PDAQALDSTNFEKRKYRRPYRKATSSRPLHSDHNQSSLAPHLKLHDPSFNACDLKQLKDNPKAKASQQNGISRVPFWPPSHGVSLPGRRFSSEPGARSPEPESRDHRH